jgi:hypothetical protein
MAGANSIFDGDKLLTTPNNDRYGGLLFEGDWGWVRGWLEGLSRCSLA